MTLSSTQLRVVDYLQAHGGRLLRWPGGFWTTPDTLLPGGSAIGTVHEQRLQDGGYNYDRHGAPVWYTTIQTVRALEKRGVLEREQVQKEWCDPRRLRRLTTTIDSAEGGLTP